MVVFGFHLKIFFALLELTKIFTLIFFSLDIFSIFLLEPDIFNIICKISFILNDLPYEQLKI